MRNQVKINQWLKERNLVCEENFGESLYNLALEYSEKNQVTLESVWKELGVTKQNINYWRYHDQSLTTQLMSKRMAILNAESLFQLSISQRDDLATRAGLSVLDSADTKKSNIKFSHLFAEKLISWNDKPSRLYQSLGIDKTTFYRIKSGVSLRKDTLIILFILMDFTSDEIKEYLKIAGYTLSQSIPREIIISWLLEKDLKSTIGEKCLEQINHLLYDLELPLLQTRK